MSAAPKPPPGCWVAVLAILAVLTAGAAGPVSAQELRYQTLQATDGIPLNVVSAGRSDKPAILLLHGFSQSYLSWIAQFEDPRLLEQFHIVAMDLRGHGASGKPWRSEAYLDAGPWADDIRRVISELELQSPLLVGWSFGGFVLLDYVRIHGTEGLGGLMLVGSHGGLLPMPVGTPNTMNGNLAAQLQDGEAFMARMSAQPLSAAEMERGVVSFMTLPAYARRAMSGKNYDNADLAPALDLPVRFLLGSKEPFVDREAVTDLAGELPCADVVIQQGAGHMPFAEAPALFDEQLLAFFSLTLVRDGVSTAQGCVLQ